MAFTPLAAATTCIDGIVRRMDNSKICPGSSAHSVLLQAMCGAMQNALEFYLKYTTYSGYTCCPSKTTYSP